MPFYRTNGSAAERRFFSYGHQTAESRRGQPERPWVTSTAVLTLSSMAQTPSSPPGLRAREPAEVAISVFFYPFPLEFRRLS